MRKGLVVGSVNAAIALARGAELPDARLLVARGLLGLASWRVIHSLFVAALCEASRARTGASFSTVPFIGAALSVLVLHAEVSARLLIAGGLREFGAWLHLTESHSHPHAHDAVVHAHAYGHDDHHHPQHEPGDPEGEPPVHARRHEPVTPAHDHQPDIHHMREHR